jgi:anti-sigma factor RsiW
MNCDTVRLHLRELQAGRLPAAAEGEMQTHLTTCGDCAHVAAVEAELTDALERRLPQYPASFALKRRLAAGWPARPRPRAWWRAWPAPAAALAMAVLVLAVVSVERSGWRGAGPAPGMVTEAVNDHLRVLSSQRPLEIESGGLHQVKPWFEGRLDFAPVVTFEGDADFPLKGGAVGYFFDRRAAVFVYARRLHPISLFVFRADGLAWPRRDEAASTTAERGFTVVLWRRGPLGYALVSDVDRGDLEALAARLRPQPGGSSGGSSNP